MMLRINRRDSYEFELARAVVFIEALAPGCDSNDDKHQVASVKWPKVPEPSFTTRSKLPLVVLDRYQTHPTDGFLPCLYPMNEVEPCAVALGPVDSLHDGPNPIWIMGSRKNYTQRAVGGTADDKKYCTDVEYALQNKSRRPGAPANVRFFFFFF